MRKKIFGALLLGLFTVATTSTMVSCKDYDDDISNLKSQINSLSDLVTQKETTINTSIANLQTAINQANTDHATKAALEEAKDILAAAIENESKDRATADAELSAAIAKAQAAADAAAKLAAQNESSIAQTNADLAQTNANLTQAKADLTAAISKVASDLASTNDNLNTLSANLTKAEGQIGELKAALAAQIAKCEAANSELTQEVKDLKAYVDTQDAALKAALEQEIAGVKTQMATDEAKEAADYAELKQLHNDNAANITALQTKMDKLYNETIPAIETRLGNLDVLTTALAKTLTSLVYIPNLYVDGIETIEYPFVKDTALVAKDDAAFKRHRVGEDVDQTIRNVYDYETLNEASAAEILAAEVVYGPAMGVDYHLNPTNAVPAYSDVKGFVCRSVDVVTRSVDNSLGITSPETYDNGNALYAVNNGIVTVGLKIANPKQLLTNWPEIWAVGEKDGLHGYTQSEGAQTGDRSEGKENIIALQIARDSKSGSDSVITSDYAMLQPNVLHPEGIVWTKANARGAVNTVDEAGSHSWQFAPWVPCQNTCIPSKDNTAQNGYMHVWDTPQEALTHVTGVQTGATISADDPGTPDILLPYNDESGVTLSDYIGTHVLNRCPLFKTTNAYHNWINTWSFSQEHQYGLMYYFELVDYTIDGNATIDSRYSIIDPLTGKIVARDVNEDGTTNTSHTADKNNTTCIGREPLVRVRLITTDSYNAYVKAAAGKTAAEQEALKKTVMKTLLDGYILVRISKQGSEKKDHELPEVYNEQSWEFDLCNATALTRTTWSTFDYKILDDLDLEKLEDFDAQYTLDVRSDWAVLDQPDGGKIYSAKVFTKDANGKFVEDTYKDAAGHVTWFGNVLYYHNMGNVNNHAFKPVYTEDEMEYMTHDLDNGGSYDKSVWVRYVGKNDAKYTNVYVKFIIHFTRKATDKTGIKTKDNNYWYAKDGNMTGWDAIVFNTEEPVNDAPDTKWSNSILKTFTTGSVATNHVGFTNSKFGAETTSNPYISNTNAGADFGYSYRKFYFAPIVTTITDLHGKKWTITAQRHTKDVVYNHFYCHASICCSDDHREPATPLGYSHGNPKLDADVSYNAGISEYRGYGQSYGYVAGCTYMLNNEATHEFAVDGEAPNWALNSATLQKCAIDYYDGVFTNNKLYAVCEGDTTHYLIATMNQQTGVVTLNRTATTGTTPNTATEKLYTAPLDMVLNAIGYEGDNHENLSKELHTYVGVVVNNGCGVAVDMYDPTINSDAHNATVFETSWQRPINLVLDGAPLWDADNNGDGIDLLECLKMYDWRGPVEGNMETYKWLYGYYNVYAITFNVDDKAVYTTMHKTTVDDNFDPVANFPGSYWKLNQASSLVNLYAANHYDAATDTYTIDPASPKSHTGHFDFTPYANHASNQYAKDYATKNIDDFGYIYYTNNEQNVKDFYIAIPVEICYEWGHLDEYLFIRIHGTLGNNGAKAIRK